MSKNQFKSISYCRNAADYQIELDTYFIYFRLTSRYIKWIHYHQLTNRANFYSKISSLRPRHHTELNNVVYCTRYTTVIRTMCEVPFCYFFLFLFTSSETTVQISSILQYCVPVHCYSTVPKNSQTRKERKADFEGRRPNAYYCLASIVNYITMCTANGKHQVWLVYLLTTHWLMKKWI